MKEIYFVHGIFLDDFNIGAISLIEAGIVNSSEVSDSLLIISVWLSKNVNLMYKEEKIIFR